MSATGIDEAKLEQFMGQFVGDLGAAMTAPLVLIGDKLGLYKAMADGEPVTPEELAERTDCRERYIREWLCQQAASGYVEYDAADGTFTAAARAGDGAGRRRQPGVHPGRVPARGGGRQGRAAHRRALPLGRGLRLARAPRRPVRGHRAVLPPGLPREPRRRVAAGARRRRREALPRRPRRGHRLRTRRLDDPDGRRRSRRRSSSDRTTTRARSKPPAPRPSARGSPIA